MNGACNGNFFFDLTPWALGRGLKVKCHLISIKKSISKIFIPHFVCVLTNGRYKTYQMGFSFYPLGHVPCYPQAMLSGTSCALVPSGKAVWLRIEEWNMHWPKLHFFLAFYQLCF